MELLQIIISYRSYTLMIRPTEVSIDCMYTNGLLLIMTHIEMNTLTCDLQFTEKSAAQRGIDLTSTSQQLWRTDPSVAKDQGSPSQIRIAPPSTGLRRNHIRSTDHSLALVAYHSWRRVCSHPLARRPILSELPSCRSYWHSRHSRGIRHKDRRHTHRFPGSPCCLPS